MRESHSSGLGLAMIGMAALFLAGFFLLVIFGAQSFRNTASGRRQNMDTRDLLAYLATVAKANDRAGAVTLRSDETMGDVLVIADGDSGYATHLFCYGGALLEDYTRLGGELSPERAARIAATQRFELSFSGGLIEIVTDAGRVLIHPRSGGEAA